MMRPDRARSLREVPERSDACIALIAAVALRLEERRVDIADELLERLTPELPEFEASDEVTEDFRAAALGCLTLVHAMAQSWSDPREVPPPSAAISWARGLVGRGLPNVLVLRTFRLGEAIYRDVWFDQLQATRAPAELLLEAVHVCGVFISLWVDAITQQLLEAYEEERTLRIRGEGARRAEALRRVLDGSLHDERTASTQLGYELARGHQAFVMWSPRPDHDAALWLETLMQTAVSNDAPAPLLIESTATTATASLAGGGIARQVTGALASSPNPPRLALGEAHHGIAGLRRSVEEARRAYRAARLGLGAGRIVRFSDVEAVELLTRDMNAAQAFTGRVLGALVGDEPSMAQLRETLTVFYDERLRLTQTGRRLGVHANTIASRISRAEGLLPEHVRPWEVRLALELLATRGTT